MVNVAILGFGTVGSGVAEVLTTNGGLIDQRVENLVRLKYILDVRDFPDSGYYGGGNEADGNEGNGRPDLQSDRIRTVDQIRGLLERRGLGFSFPAAFLYGIWLWCRRHGKTNNQNNSIQ